MSLLIKLIPGLGIHSASKNCNIDSVKKYLANGSDINTRDKNGMTPLFWVLRTYPETGSSQAMVEFLLANGADVNARDRWGLTPLHLAATNGHKNAAAALIASSCKIDATDIKGKTPLHLAVESDRLSVANILIANGAKTDMRYGFLGLTLLDFTKSLEMSELLEKNGTQLQMYSWVKAIHFILAVFEKLVSFGLSW